MCLYVAATYLQYLCKLFSNRYNYPKTKRATKYEQNAYGRTTATWQSLANHSAATCGRWNHPAMAGHCLDGFCWNWHWGLEIEKKLASLETTRWQSKEGGRHCTCNTKDQIHQSQRRTPITRQHCSDSFCGVTADKKVKAMRVAMDSLVPAISAKKETIVYAATSYARFNSSNTWRAGLAAAGSQACAAMSHIWFNSWNPCRPLLPAAGSQACAAMSHVWLTSSSQRRLLTCKSVWKRSYITCLGKR